MHGRAGNNTITIDDSRNSDIHDNEYYRQCGIRKIHMNFSSTTNH